MLRVSRGLSWVQSGDLVCGSDSPVRDELSTCKKQSGNVEKSYWLLSHLLLKTQGRTVSESLLRMSFMCRSIKFNLLRGALVSLHFTSTATEYCDCIDSGNINLSCFCKLLNVKSHSFLLFCKNSKEKQLLLCEESKTPTQSF